MFQIIFNELSAAELSELPKTLQLTLLSEFQLLPEDLDRLADGKGSFGRIERDGKKLFRYRASDYRIYFETCPQGGHGPSHPAQEHALRLSFPLQTPPG